MALNPDTKVKLFKFKITEDAPTNTQIENEINTWIHNTNQNLDPGERISILQTHTAYQYNNPTKKNPTKVDMYLIIYLYYIETTAGSDIPSSLGEIKDSLDNIYGALDEVESKLTTLNTNLSSIKDNLGNIHTDLNDNLTTGSMFDDDLKDIAAAIREGNP